jgi:hypothetical protein
MSISGLNLLAANYNAMGGKVADLTEEGDQGAQAKHGSVSVNNLAQKDHIEQAEEVTVNTDLTAKKPGSPTNIDGQAHTATGDGVSEVDQDGGQEASADFAAKAVNNESEIAIVDQAEKIATNLNVDVLAAPPRHGPSCGSPCGTPLTYWAGRGPCWGGLGQGPHPGLHPYAAPDAIQVNLNNHTADADLLSTTTQEGDQLAKANHGSTSINNLKQASTTNQAEDVSVNADVNVQGPGPRLGGPVLVTANGHTASGTAVAASVQDGDQTAISDNGSLSINNMSQCNFVHQNEKVGVNTNVVV